MKHFSDILMLLLLRFVPYIFQQELVMLGSVPNQITKAPAYPLLTSSKWADASLYLWINFKTITAATPNLN
ncbi:MAG: hypothetical protein EZS28_039544 [Streblomastix strix]|uniref:Uncharacterized protein n=1 Tax=Streblomastix strix TaxID=222440 RepID=A0A5J4U3L7_9EUKA|nr:MAG: hypothetical protein EZS28_039544 [Streblomastix strix]